MKKTSRKARQSESAILGNAFAEAARQAAVAVSEYWAIRDANGICEASTKALRRRNELETIADAAQKAWQLSLSVQF